MECAPQHMSVVKKVMVSSVLAQFAKSVYVCGWRGAGRKVHYPESQNAHAIAIFCHITFILADDDYNFV